MKNITIKFKLTSLAVLVGIVLFITAGLSFSEMKEIQHINQLSLHTKNIEKLMLEMRKSEKDFMLRSTSDKAYYQTKKSKYITKFDKLLEEVYNLNDVLLNDGLIKDLKLQKELSDIKTNFKTYNEGFKALVVAKTERGYKDFGLIGNLRKAVYGINEHFKEIKYLEVIVLHIRKNEKDYLLRKDLKYQIQLQENVDKLKKLIKKDRKLKKNVKAELLEELDIYSNAFLAIINIDKKIGFTEKDGLQKEFRAAAHEVEPSVSKLVSILLAESERTFQNSITMGVSIITIFILVLSLIMFFIISSIRKSLTDAQEIVKAVAEGDFSKNIELKQNDEIGQLQKDIAKMLDKLRFSVFIAKSVSEGDLMVLKKSNLKNFGGELDDALKNMVDKLNNIITNISTATQNINSGSRELSTISAEIASGSNEQAASTEEVSASMEEMTANVSQNTENALIAEKISTKSAIGITEGYESFKSTLEALKTIADRITVIGDIAEKTDILAINAAIEAARAGEQGKGFAVVATEIRKLAENSQNAAKEIDKLVGKSVNIAAESEKLLSEITPEIKKTSILVQEIANAGNEQNSGANQINDAIQELTKVISENSSAADQMSASSRNILHQVISLEEAVAFFKTEDTNMSSKNIIENNKSEKKTNKLSQEQVKTKKGGYNLNLKEDEHNDDDFESY